MIDCESVLLECTDEIGREQREEETLFSCQQKNDTE